MVARISTTHGFKLFLSDLIGYSEMLSEAVARQLQRGF